MKPRTAAQKAASRTNGEKSRGPVTSRGKRKASQNGIRHGLRASGVVMPDENPGAYNRLRREVLASLAVNGALETLIGEMVCSALWRARRADLVEAETLEAMVHDQECNALARAIASECNTVVPTVELGVMADQDRISELQRARRALRDPEHSLASRAFHRDADHPTLRAVNRARSGAERSLLRALRSLEISRGLAPRRGERDTE